MFKLPLAEVKDKLKKEAHLTDEELDARIKQKMDQLSGLISEEGACHIIANELKVDLFEQGRVKIKNVLPGMRNLELLGKVMKKYNINHFDTGERKGKVGSMVLGDETGMIKVAMWHDQADNLDKLNDGDVVEIKSAYARENRGVKEVHLNDNSKLIINPEGKSVGEVREVQEKSRKEIKELKEGDQNVEVLGTIVQVFELRFFTVCPECGKRVYEKDGLYECGVHGLSKPDYAYVLNLFLDDGTENIRTTFWREQVKRLTGKTDEEILKYRDETDKFEEVKNDLLGNIIKVVGRVNKNEMFDRLEFSARLVFPEPNPEEELKKLD